MSGEEEALGLRHQCIGFKKGIYLHSNIKKRIGCIPISEGYLLTALWIARWIFSLELISKKKAQLVRTVREFLRLRLGAWQLIH